MKRGFLAVLLGAMILFTFGCKPKGDEKEAIRGGVIKHLTALNMLNLNNMDVSVTQATINGTQAQAQVEIRAKGGDSAGNAMQIGYAMEKRGEEWVVLKSTGMGGGMQHPGPGEAPAGTTPGAMPPGHPNVTGGSGQTPATHPDFNAILNSAPSQQANPPAQPPPASKRKP